MTLQPIETRFALRFDRKQAHALRSMAFAIQADGKNPEIFDKAADSAEQGEPLIIIGYNRDEAEQMASEFVKVGFQRPAIDELNT